MKNLNVVYLIVKNNVALCAVSSRRDAESFAATLRKEPANVSVCELNLFDAEGYEAKLVRTKVDTFSLVQSAVQSQN